MKKLIALFNWLWPLALQRVRIILGVGREAIGRPVTAPCDELDAEFRDRAGLPALELAVPRPMLSPEIHRLSPLDNPTNWQRFPAHEPIGPAKDVDVEAVQQSINDIWGTAPDRGAGDNEIFKLVWNGDQRYWLEYYIGPWYGDGRPNCDVTRRPRYLYGHIYGPYKKLIRDVFPPRWILLTRLEPEQYAHRWYEESHFWDPGYRCWKQIRPIDPPPVYWMNYALVANHRNGCCARNRKCFGEYTSPERFLEILRLEKEATDKQGKRNPFEKVDPEAIRMMNDRDNGYRYEMKQLEVEAEVMQANPMAAIGLAAAVAADPTHAQAVQRVKDFYNRQIDELADKWAKGQPLEDHKH